MYDLVLRSRRTCLPDGERPAAIAVHNGRIAAVAPHEADLPAHTDTDLGELALLPGLVDTHVHVNEPGRTEWEGFATATAAAAAGGVTTIIDMPLNSLPPTVDVAALNVKRQAAQGRCFVDVGFWGGAIPGKLHELPALHAEGVFGFKCFTVDSGVPEFPPLSWPEIDQALHRLVELDALLVVHAEDSEELATAPAAEGKRYQGFLASRPTSAENTAIARLAAITAGIGARAHVLHLSSAEALSIVAEAKAAGVRLSAETCPHYLTLTAESVPDGATEFKCCPPIRDAANQDQLWAGLADGVIDCVVSDHSPCTPDLKSRGGGDFGQAWGGVSSLQLGLPVLWTAARARGRPLAEVVRWLAERPADLAGLSHKGRIAVGCDADLVAFAADERFTVTPGELRHRHPITPYAGRELTGVVRRTWLRGKEIGARPHGELLRRDGG
ncbi:allantoinase AllB [Crossiella sp. CA-258035]|uniref:allantoinase AllB n=1 Tax=Crossiella sp. CA-258035 TaxID=2981138 RepID=UPI0024BC0E5B|nr:allantoinase AllB [Crossiella sp. CA-258035]WHT17733.1 allantoinase AllB [Crossiella sp. CA-258035]